MEYIEVRLKASTVNYFVESNLDIQVMNDLLIDILKKLSLNLNDTVSKAMENNIHNQILDKLTELGTNVNTIRHDLFHKLAENKREYIDDIRSILSNHHLTVAEKTQSILDKNIEIIVCKTSNLISEAFPRHTSQLEDTIRQMNQSLSQNVGQMVDSFNRDEKNITQLITNVEQQFNNLLSGLQQPLFSLIQSSSESVVSKTSSMMNEIIPRHHSQTEDSLRRLGEQLKHFSDIIAEKHQPNADIVSILDNVRHLTDTLHASLTLKSETDTQTQNAIHQVKEIVSKDKSSDITLQLNQVVTNIQQPLFSVIQSNNERLLNEVQFVRDKMTAQDTVLAAMVDSGNKQKHNSSIKGNASELALQQILEQIFCSDEVVNCSTETSACDFRVNRMSSDKPTILFENKCYSRTVATVEVVKFERDVKNQKCHGIFISQTSNITFKEPFHIDIIDGLIHVYVPCAENNIDLIRGAVHIVDALHTQLALVQTPEDINMTVVLTADDIDELSDMCSDFRNRKATLRAHLKKSVDMLDDLNIDQLTRLLLRNGVNFDVVNKLKCPHCQMFEGKNKASLAAHIRKCKTNNTNVVACDLSDV